MQCDDFEIRLNEVLDDRRPISSAADLNEHIRQCGECRHLAHSYEAVFAGLREALIPSEPEWVSRRVLEQVRPRFARLTFRRVETLLTLAAAILLAVGLTWLAVSSNRPLASSRLKAINFPLAQQPAGDNQPAADNFAADKIVEKADKSSQTSPPAERERSGELMEFLPSSAWAHDVADGLQPVTEPTVGAITGFLRLWGVGDEGHRS